LSPSPFVKQIIRLLLFGAAVSLQREGRCPIVDRAPMTDSILRRPGELNVQANREVLVKTESAKVILVSDFNLTCRASE
jgi:hypothetical protein